jgi:hypothetical protein
VARSSREDSPRSAATGSPASSPTKALFGRVVDLVPREDRDTASQCSRGSAPTVSAARSHAPVRRSAFPPTHRTTCGTGGHLVALGRRPRSGGRTVAWPLGTGAPQDIPARGHGLGRDRLLVPRRWHAGGTQDGRARRNRCLQAIGSNPVWALSACMDKPSRSTMWAVRVGDATTARMVIPR